MPDWSYVDHPSRCLDRIDGVRRVGVDTEFMREKTFYAQLCLVQVATGSEVLVVDPLAGGDLEPFWDVLLAREWVSHSARQDIEVVYQSAARMPAALFDTQVAAALLGHPPQLGYAGLVKALFNVDLPKSHTRANWAARPLPEAFLAYAAEDVEFLLPARDRLASELDHKGRLAWAEADSALLLDPALYATDPDGSVFRLKSLKSLTGTRRAAAAALAAWRETEAMQRNLPRQWILKDAVLTDIAVRQPASARELERIEGLPPRMVKRAGPAILEAVAAAVAATGHVAGDEPRRARRGGPDERQKALLQALQTRIAACASDLGLAAETIASRKELTAVILEGERESRLFTGWRRELIGNDIAKML